MDGKNINAIVLQGINHHLDKIGVDDGMCDDLVNIRYKDGSWRTTGEGKLVYKFGKNTYTNLYVHTNIYRHVIGSRKYKKTVINENGSTSTVQKVGLFWFANIDNDGVFTTIDEVCIADAPVGDKFIYAQTGHILVVISKNVRTTLFFDRGNNKYLQEEVLEGGDAYSHPMKNVKYKVVDRYNSSGKPLLVFAPTTATVFEESSTTQTFSPTHSAYVDSTPTVQAAYNVIQRVMKEQGSFGGAFLVCLALKLYSGDWTWATAPTLIYPSYMGDNKMRAQNGINSSYRTSFGDPFYVMTKDQITVDDKETIVADIDVKKGAYTYKNGQIETMDIKAAKQSVAKWCGEIAWNELPTVGDCFWRPGEWGNSATKKVVNAKTEHLVWGKLNDLYINLEELNVQSTTIYKSVGVFVTPLIGNNGNPLDITNIKFSDNHNYDYINTSGQSVSTSHFPYDIPQSYAEGQFYPTVGDGSAGTYSAPNGVISRWLPKHIMSKDEWDKDNREIRDALLASHFYLINEIPIKEWKEEIAEHSNDDEPWFKKIELKPEALVSIGEDSYNVLSANAFNSMSFTNAEYGMTFNGRLHLANYKKSTGTVWGNNHLIDRDYSDGSRRNLESGLNKHALKYEKTASGTTKSECLASAKSIATEMSKKVPHIFSVNNFMDNIHVLDKVEVNTGSAIWDKEPDKGDSKYSALIGNQILSTFIAYPSVNIDSMDVYINQENVNGDSNVVQDSCKKTAQLTLGDQYEMLYYPIRFYFNFLESDYELTTQTDGKLFPPSDLDVVVEDGEKDVPNGIIVSGAQTPTYFTDEYTIGSSEIVAIAANAMAVGTGQTGDVPLYVFCKDGVYGLFIDSAGDIAYSTSRVLTRDVISNANSVKPIDNGVVFTTKRGLMLMSGEKAVEIGQPVEGDWCKFDDSTSNDYDKIAANSYKMNKIADLPTDTNVKTDFLSYINGADTMVNYNHNERELIVSNPDYDYSYIMDRDGNWSRRTFTADEYLDNFPTSYRVKDGKFYQLDEEDNADNGMFILSRELKLDSIGFKELNRLVARGFFETGSAFERTTKSVCAKGDVTKAIESKAISFDQTIGSVAISVSKTTVFEIPKHTGIVSIERNNMEIKSDSYGKVKLYITPSNSPLSVYRQENELTLEDDSLVGDILEDRFTLAPGNYTVTLKVAANIRYKSPSIVTQSSEDDDDVNESSGRLDITGGSISSGTTITPTVPSDTDQAEELPVVGNIKLSYEAYSATLAVEFTDVYVGLYVYGSYDARKWVLLGHKEKKGSFNDIGCVVERSDCKFFRFVLAGKLKETSRLDYFEASSKDSKLSTKIR